MMEKALNLYQRTPVAICPLAWGPCCPHGIKSVSLDRGPLRGMKSGVLVPRDGHRGLNNYTGRDPIIQGNKVLSKLSRCLSYDYGTYQSL